MKQANVFLVILLLALSGCTTDDPGSVGKEIESPGDSRSPLEILQAMVKTYREAESYQDQGVVTLSYRYANESRRDVSQAAVKWSKPGRLGVRAYQLSLAVDGDRLRAVITDESTGDMDNQLLVRPAGKGISLADLYADSMVKDVLVGGRGGQPVQLELLMQENPLAGFLDKEVSREILPAADVEGHACYRVAVTTIDGRYELWVDQENFLLRRLAYPAVSFAGDMLADPQVKDVQLVAELRSAELNPQLGASEFTLRVPEKARQVERFVIPPQPLPTDLYGKRVGIFQFKGLDGSTVSREELAGKVTVLMWFVDHEANRSTVAQLDQVASQFKDDPRVSVYAVCTEPADVPDQQIQVLEKDWQLSLPVMRDLEAYGRDIFRIPVAPTLVVLDGKSRLQLFEPGPNAELAKQLPMVLKQLVEGKDLAAETLAQFAEEHDLYQQELGQAHRAALTSTQIKPASEPELFELEELWSRQGFQESMNPLLVMAPDGSWHLDVLDAGSVVRLDMRGEITGRFDLKLAEKAPVTYLRTAVDSIGKRWFAAGQMGGSRVYVYDEQWKKQLTFPRAEQSHPGIEDFRLADLDGDGAVELYLGYRGLVGLQRVSLAGLREWSYRGVERVLSLAPAGNVEEGAGYLLLTTEAGRAHRLNPAGQDVREIDVPDVTMHYLFPAAFKTSSGAQFCAVASTNARVAVGLDRELKQVWQYQLPAGTFSTDLRFVQSADLLGDGGGQWLVAAADGTLHIVSADGEFADQFATGRQLSGFTAGRHGTDAVLFLADKKSVTAWRVRRRSVMP